jgi:DNA ligase 4
MQISVKETTVFAVFHPDAQDLYNTCSDLKRVAWELWDPAHRLNPEDKNIQLFHAFAPMLCKRPTRKLEETVKEMGGTEFIIEEKLDGERMQLHKRGNEYFYCSRCVFSHILSGTLCHDLTAKLKERQGLHLSLWKACWYWESHAIH